jgi:hypothetical protein
MKAQYKWSYASIDASLQYWHNLLPDENTCLSSLDKDKKIMCPLDLLHENYHACFNDCCIYQKEDTDKTTCLVCNAAWYRLVKKAPRKVVWYFPLIPRLQRYFTNCKESKIMRWQAERKEAVLMIESGINRTAECRHTLRMQANGTHYTLNTEVLRQI